MEYYLIVIGILLVDLAISLFATNKPFKVPFIIASLLVLATCVTMLIWGTKTPIAPFEYNTDVFVDTLNKAIAFIISTYFTVIFLSVYCWIMPSKRDFSISVKTAKIISIIIAITIFVAGTVATVMNISQIKIL